ncbi:hypothetical protein [Vibrio antiquarius]
MKAVWEGIAKKFMGLDCQESQWLALD